MYKIYIDENSYNYLKEWTEKCKRFVLDCPAVAPKFMIICKIGKADNEIVLYVSETKYGYKFNFNYQKKLIAKGKILRTPQGENDFKISYDLSDLAMSEFLSDEFTEKEKFINTVMPHFIEMYCNSFIMANAFLMYGNVIDEKNIIASGRNSGSDKIIVFRPYNDTLYAVPVGHHRSPEGVFGVRGHLRHYRKTGKIVWIESYLKGVDNDK